MHGAQGPAEKPPPLARESKVRRAPAWDWETLEAIAAGECVPDPGELARTAAAAQLSKSRQRKQRGRPPATPQQLGQHPLPVTSVSVRMLYPRSSERLLNSRSPGSTGLCATLAEGAATPVIWNGATPLMDATRAKELVAQATSGDQGNAKRRRHQEFDAVLDLLPSSRSGGHSSSCTRRSSVAQASAHGSETHEFESLEINSTEFTVPDDVVKVAASAATPQECLKHTGLYAVPGADAVTPHVATAECVAEDASATKVPQAANGEQGDGVGVDVAEEELTGVVVMQTEAATGAFALLKHPREDKQGDGDVLGLAANTAPVAAADCIATDSPLTKMLQAENHEQGNGVGFDAAECTTGTAIAETEAATCASASLEKSSTNKRGARNTAGAKVVKKARGARRTRRSVCTNGAARKLEGVVVSVDTSEKTPRQARPSQAAPSEALSAEGSFEQGTRITKGAKVAKKVRGAARKLGGLVSRVDASEKTPRQARTSPAAPPEALFTEGSSEQGHEVQQELLASSTLAAPLASAEMCASTEPTSCSICCMDVPAFRSVRLRCGHGWYCASCVLRYAESRLAVGKPDLPCPDCGAEVAEHEMRRLLPEEVVEAFLARSLELAVCMNADLRPCPTPGCPMRVALAEDGANRFKCPLCQKTCCAQCGWQPYHSGLTCAQRAARPYYKARKRNQPTGNGAAQTATGAANISTAQVDEGLLQWMNEHGAKQCPCCRSAVTKHRLQGQHTQRWECHKMICLACGTRFCFKCLTILTESKSCGCTSAAHGFVDPHTGKVVMHNRKQHGRQKQQQPKKCKRER